MSVEYRASAKLDAAKAGAVLDELGREAGWSVVARSERELSLKWAGGTGKRPDVSVEVETDGVYLASHAGTRQQREQLVAKVTAALARQGVRVEFEEL